MALRNSLKSTYLREALWLTPFLLIGIISLGLLRPLPHFPPPAHSRTVMGSDGVPIQIALPFRGIAMAPPISVGSYLEDSRAPQLLKYAGDSKARQDFSKSLMSQLYPKVLSNNHLWRSGVFQKSTSPYVELETLLAYDPSVYLGCGGPLAPMRSVGLPVLSIWGSCGGQQKPFACPGSQVHARWSYYSEGVFYIQLRVISDLIGQPELADARIASYCQSLADLEKELQPRTLDYRPRVVMAGQYKGDFARAGIVDAETERVIPGDDAERLLIMDPDMIFFFPGSPKDFMQDPRWNGLKAVRDRRVYRWEQSDVTVRPAALRWLAEIAHPDRLHPKVRQLMRDRMMSEFGYRLNDDQIDQMLHVKENSDSVGTERFASNYRAENQQETQR
jgi:ABC-type Fe3+-hydroxamate transport system substrate-binding protein